MMISFCFGEMVYSMAASMDSSLRISAAKRRIPAEWHQRLPTAGTADLQTAFA
jgi:hypothetical protein